MTKELLLKLAQCYSVTLGVTGATCPSVGIGLVDGYTYGENEQVVEATVPKIVNQWPSDGGNEVEAERYLFNFSHERLVEVTKGLTLKEYNQELIREQHIFKGHAPCTKDGIRYFLQENPNYPFFNKHYTYFLTVGLGGAAGCDW